MESRPNNPTCPVCKSKIERERLIPLYGRGANDKVDPRYTIPSQSVGACSSVCNMWNFSSLGIGEHVPISEVS